jgi:oligogalacturonide lyase
MAVGDLLPAESRVTVDPDTGRTIRQVTSHRSTHHHPFYYVPAYDDAMRRLIFISHRTGRAEIFAELRASGRLQQLTAHAGLAEWSIHPSHDGRHVYFTDQIGGWRVDLETLREECLVTFPGAEMREAGMVGAAMGTTALSGDDRWWAVPVKDRGVSRLFIIDTATGKGTVILERDTIGHPQFHPDDPTWLRYAGSHRDRIWVLRRDGTEHHLAFERDAMSRQWIVHETWLPGTNEILTADWPHGLLRIDVRSGEARRILGFNAWHPMVNRAGTLVVTDTTFPDTGLWLCGVDPSRHGLRPLCASRATNQGAHWATDHCPYDDGPVTIDAPQHTHPHPGFAPDDSVVLFTSDFTGHAQLYECTLRPDDLPPRRREA